nr:MAG TPA: hypothetical protein [Caudoviricetes sp.]
MVLYTACGAGACLVVHILHSLSFLTLIAYMLLHLRPRTFNFSYFFYTIR